MKGRAVSRGWVISGVDLGGRSGRKEKGRIQRWVTKVTQCYLQLGSLENGAHVDIKGKSEPRLLWREPLSYLKTELKLLIFSPKEIIIDPIFKVKGLRHVPCFPIVFIFNI